MTETAEAFKKAAYSLAKWFLNNGRQWVSIKLELYVLISIPGGTCEHFRTDNS
jgi:hypothetical protein